MVEALTRKEAEGMLAKGLSQREISRRTGIPRRTLQRLLKAPLIPEVVPTDLPAVSIGPLTQLSPQLQDAEPVLLEMVAWWLERKAAVSTPVGGHRETRRYTFHAEVSLIDLVQQEADAERVSYSEMINRALRHYFGGR